MPIQADNIQPGSILRRKAIFGPEIIIPVSDTAAICASQVPTLGAALTLNGLGIVTSGGKAVLPYPIEPVITPSVNTDIFTTRFRGLDQFGIFLELSQAHASGVVNQRMASATGNRFYSEIWEIVVTNESQATSAITVGWKVAQAADGGTGANQTQRVPLLVSPPGVVSSFIGMYVTDGGGGTFAAGNGQGAMLKAGLANYTTFPTTGPTLYIGYGANPSVLPTRPMTLLPVYAPGTTGNPINSGGSI